MKILDLSAGKRAVWFNRLHPDTVYVDMRPEMYPTVVADTKALPFNHCFDLIVFDPPHMTHGPNSAMAKTYTSMLADEIKDLIRKTSREAYRCAHDGTLMAFKWNDHDVRLDHILPLMEGWEPLFGHKTAWMNARGSSTVWVMLKKRIPRYEGMRNAQRVLEYVERDL